MGQNHHVEAAVQALIAHWENPQTATRSHPWDEHSLYLLTVLAWILDEWTPAEA